MTLTAADVAEIMRVIEQSTFDELTLEMEGVKLTLRRAGAGFVESVTTETPPPGGQRSSHAPPTPIVSSAPSSPAAVAGGREPNLAAITAPMLGTFYRAPKPGSAPFVEVGSSVEAGSIIAIIEVMKLMNTVRAGVRGVIREILPADESLVEFGDVLMHVRTDA